MRSYLATGLAVALFGSVGLAACNEAGDDTMEQTPPAQTEPMTDPTTTDPMTAPADGTDTGAGDPPVQ